MKYRSKIGMLWMMCIAFMLWLTYEICRSVDTNNWEWWIGAVTIIGSDLLFFNLTCGTWYQFHDDDLEIKCGIFSQTTIPYRDVVEFKETKNPLASVGLSMDRISIVFKAPKGRNGNREVLISPIKKQEFLKILEEKTRKKRLLRK
ncbi:MAG: PH domain-containing protein [Erysipelotrichales bacterium]|nr:PH domain-containing protein [Erysipelotrichales bacterium]